MTVEQKTNGEQEEISPMARYGRDIEIPADQITGSELRPWHVVTIECGGCGHGRVVDHRLLQRSDRAAKPLNQLNWRCDRCGMTSTDVQHRIRVVNLPRNF